MGGFILLFLIVVVMVFVVPVALAKASQALRAIEELKQRLLMLEARLHREDVPGERAKVVAEPKPAAPVIPPVAMPPPLPVTVIPRYRKQNRSLRLKKCTWRRRRRPRAPLIGSNSWGRK